MKTERFGVLQVALFYGLCALALTSCSPTRDEALSGGRGEALTAEASVEPRVEAVAQEGVEASQPGDVSPTAPPVAWPAVACSAESGVSPCPAPLVCEDGACRLADQVACESFSRCASPALVARCGIDGSVRDAYTCGQDTSCSEAAGMAECRDESCTPGLRRCGGDNEVNLCAADGRTWMTAACAEGEVCIDGACSTQECEPNETSCLDEATLALCGRNGHIESYELCAEDRRCVGDLACTCRSGVCVFDRCDDGAQRCRGGTPERCVDGEWSPGQTCDDDTYCAAGSCMRRTCTDGEARCEGDMLARCVAGVWHSSGCDGDGICTRAASEAACTEPVCERRAHRCREDGRREICEGGRAWRVAPCASGSICEDGVCLPTDRCEPGARWCSGATPMSCADDGAHMEAAEPCGEGTRCEAGACVAAACEPVAVRCRVYPEPVWHERLTPYSTLPVECAVFRGNDELEGAHSWTVSVIEADAQGAAVRSAEPLEVDAERIILGHDDGQELDVRVESKVPGCGASSATIQYFGLTDWLVTLTWTSEGDENPHDGAAINLDLLISQRPNAWDASDVLRPGNLYDTWTEGTQQGRVRGDTWGGPEVFVAHGLELEPSAMPPFYLAVRLAEAHRELTDEATPTIEVWREGVLVAREVGPGLAAALCPDPAQSPLWYVGYVDTAAGVIVRGASRDDGAQQQGVGVHLSGDPVESVWCEAVAR